MLDTRRKIRRFGTFFFCIRNHQKKILYTTICAQRYHYLPHLLSVSYSELYSAEIYDQFAYKGYVTRVHTKSANSGKI